MKGSGNFEPEMQTAAHLGPTSSITMSTPQAQVSSLLCNRFIPIRIPTTLTHAYTARALNCELSLSEGF